MTSRRVAELNISSSIYDLVGEDGELQNFIAHAGLVASDEEQSVHSVAVVHMGPPLHGQSNLSHMSANVVGSAELTSDEFHKLRTFIDRNANEHQPFANISGTDRLRRAHEMYCIIPHAVPFYEEDGRYSRMRFSCAGFIYEAYKKAGIKLVDLDRLPKVNLEDIRNAYPHYVAMMERGKLSKEKLGLEGDGDWEVLFCGYLFHSMNREASDIRKEPYSPTHSDVYFE